MNRRTRVIVAAVGMVLLAGLGSGGPTAAIPQTPPASASVASSPPKLVLLIAVDQMRYDYLTRFRDRFRGGLARLLREGAVFTNAYLEHYPSVTAPGHATMLSGATPALSGIVGQERDQRLRPGGADAGDDRPGFVPRAAAGEHGGR